MLICSAISRLLSLHQKCLHLCRWVLLSILSIGKMQLPNEVFPQCQNMDMYCLMSRLYFDDGDELWNVCILLACCFLLRWCVFTIFAICLLKFRPLCLRVRVLTYECYNICFFPFDGLKPKFLLCMRGIQCHIIHSRFFFNSTQFSTGCMIDWYWHSTILDQLPTCNSMCFISVFLFSMVVLAKVQLLSLLIWSSVHIRFTLFDISS